MTVKQNTTINENAELLAHFIADAEKRLSAQIRKQFIFMTFATLLPLTILLLIMVVVPWLARRSSEANLLRILEESNKQIATLASILLQSQPPTDATEKALKIVEQQSQLHAQVIETLRRDQSQLAPESQSLIQVVGSAAILALLGALGLQRLQNIDTEINNVRESVFAQAEARAKAIREVLQSQIAEQVHSQFKSTREEVQRIALEARKLFEGLKNEVEEVQQDMQQYTDKVMRQLQEVNALIEKYPWLRSEREYRAASQIQYLASVDEAQRLAEDFRRQGDIFSAKESLRAIVERRLPGDHADFHNAYAEAMRVKDPSLALDIVEQGLIHFPNNADLVADKVKALHSLGRAKEARKFIEEWKEAHPEQFASSWRPVVFYEDLFESLGLTEEDFLLLKETFEYVLQRLPFEIKVWAEYADLMEKRGFIDQAEEILRRGLEKNPWSQQLNFMLGDLLLRRGRGEEACRFLENALICDYQEQYQHDVNQFAVRARLAQCYEYTRQLEKAELLYRSILESQGARDLFPQLIDYAKNRLAALSLAQGKLPEVDKEIIPADAEEILRLLLQKSFDPDSIDDDKEA